MLLHCSVAFPLHQTEGDIEIRKLVRFIISHYLIVFTLSLSSLKSLFKDLLLYDQVAFLEILLYNESTTTRWGYIPSHNKIMKN